MIYKENFKFCVLLLIYFLEKNSIFLSFKKLKISLISRKNSIFFKNLKMDYNKMNFTSLPSGYMEASAKVIHELFNNNTGKLLLDQEAVIFS